jgi:hypothetical protein
MRSRMSRIIPFPEIIIPSNGENQKIGIKLDAAAPNEDCTMINKTVIDGISVSN